MDSIRNSNSNNIENNEGQKVVDNKKPLDRSLEHEPGSKKQVFEAPKVEGKEVLAREVFHADHEALLEAIYDGSAEKVEELLSQGDQINLDAKDGEGKTLLMIALAQENAEILKLLIDAGANVNIEDSDGNSALILALEDYIHSGLVEMLIGAGADLSVKDENGQNVLMLLIQNEYYDLAETLIQDGSIDLDAQEEQTGNTVLMMALEEGLTEIATLLINSGADVNIQNESGSSALILAILKDDIEIAELLITKEGTDISLTMDRGYDALMVAVAKNNPGIVKLLLENGAKAGTKTTKGDSALSLALEKGHAEVAELLINSEEGLDLSMQDYQGVTALMKATEAGNLSMVKLLVGAGAIVGIKDKEGQTALIKVRTNLMHNSNSDTDAEIFNLLIKAEADEEENNKNETNPLIKAIKGKDLWAVHQLVKDGTDIDVKDRNGRSALQLALEGDVSGMDRVLVSKAKELGLDLDMPDEHGMTALMRAIEAGNRSTAMLFIEAGANLNAQDSRGNTALSLAAEKGFNEIVGELIEENVNMDFLYDGETLLMKAIESGNRRGVATLLINAGADLDIQDSSGKTALMRAIEKRDLFISKMLIESGANLNIKAHRGETALVLALKRNHLDIATLLVDNGINWSGVDENMHTPYLLARKFLDDFEMLTSKMTAEEKEAKSLKADAKILGLVMGLDSNEELGVSTALVSSLRPYLAKTMVHVFEKMIDQDKLKEVLGLDEEQFNELIDFSNTLQKGFGQSVNLSPKECYEKYQNGELFTVAGNTLNAGHGVSYTFSPDGYCSINNRGGQQQKGDAFTGVRIVKIPDEGLTEAFFRKLIGGNTADVKTYNEMFHWELIHEIPQERQKVGNCSVANLRSGTLSMLAHYKANKLLSDGNNSITPQEAFEQASEWANNVYDYWKVYYRKEVLSGYSSHKDANPELINISQEKIDHLVEKNGLTDAFPGE